MSIIGESIVSCYADMASLLVMILLLILAERIHKSDNASMQILYRLSLCITATCVFSFICHAAYKQPAPAWHTIAVISRTLWEFSCFRIVVNWVAFVSCKLFGHGQAVGIRCELSVLCILLAVTTIFSAAAGGSQAVLADLQTGEQADAAIHTIYATMDSFKQAGTSAAWRYAVTDLDHNGQLELIAAALHPVDRSNNLKVWELSADNSSFTECTTVVPEGESFPDIISNSADTYYDAEAGTWYYIFLDHIMLSDANVYDVSCSVKLKDSSISYEQHAISHTEIVNGAMSTSYMDNNGLSISPDAYNAAAVNAFTGAERSSTNFDWFRFEDASELSVLKDSYAVFSGEKEPDKTTSPRPSVTPSVAVPIHTATPRTTAAPVPSSAPQPASKPTYLTITKNSGMSFRARQFPENTRQHWRSATSGRI